MSEKIEKIVQSIEEMKQRLREEIEKQESHITYEIDHGIVSFEAEVLKRQKLMMKDLFIYFREIPLLHFLVSPLIYIMVIPAMLFDVSLFVYQQVVCRIFKFEPIKRSDYIVYDRHYLGYLNPVEKLNCMYCSYFNGLMQYAAAMAARTELYFCPIKHAKKTAYEHQYYHEFFIYGEEENYQERLKELRTRLQMHD
jgi:hypothetical protein